MSSTRAPEFASIASRYDELRPVDDHWWEVYALVERLGDLRGRRVLDVGCGTGRVAAALYEHAHATVWGVDAEPAMLEQARARVPRPVALKQARAESLPFKDAWFDRAVFWLVLHLVDRVAALAEARRVVGPGGRVAVVSFDESHFDAYWLNRFLPSLERIDRARFPTRSQLETELQDAGFGHLQIVRHDQRATIDRGDALRRLHGRHISTLRMLDPAEYAHGTERAEAELPPVVEYDLRWLIAVGEAT